MVRRRINWKKIKWGSLKRWLLEHRASIRRKYGDPFTITGELNDWVLWELYRDERFLKRLAGTHWKTIKKKLQFKLYVLPG